MKIFKKFLTVLFFTMFCSCSWAQNFVPVQPVISINEIKPGMQGYILTVMKGTEPSKLPVKIVSIMPQKPGTNINVAILIKFMGKHKLAQGMSGSPLYVKGKLAGAVRSGWENSDQSLALVTPIDSMSAVFSNYPSDPFATNGSPSQGEMSEGQRGFTEWLSSASLTLSGMNQNSISKLSKSLGVDIAQGISINMNPQTIQNYYFKPGDAISALLVWGDVELSAAGTVTATSSDGRFLAFGHEFMNRGKSLYPSARAYIHDTVYSNVFPFKLASPIFINGTIIQDREAAIAGQAGYFAPSFSAEMIFRNLDTNKENRYKFRVAADEFMSAKLLEGILTGLASEAWGRKGQGTMSVNLKIEGRNVPYGWTRKDIFYSNEDIVEAAFKDTIEIINSYLTQPFADTMPTGFTITAEASQNPKILRIEEITTVPQARPGEEIEVKVKLRGWRMKPVERKFKLKIPEHASGVAEILVRGGISEPMPQVALNEGLKSINSLERMLAEFKAADANNELILEIATDTTAEDLKNAIARKNSGFNPNIDLLPEEGEFLSETKERRIKEGTLKIYSSEYFIDGMMKKMIRVEK